MEPIYTGTIANKKVFVTFTKPTEEQKHLQAKMLLRCIEKELKNHGMGLAK